MGSSQTGLVPHSLGSTKKKKFSKGKILIDGKIMHNSAYTKTPKKHDENL